MQTPYYEAVLSIDHEAVKARALELRSQAVDSAWKQLVSKVAGLVDGLRLDATSPSGEPRTGHFGPRGHRPG